MSPNKNILCEQLLPYLLHDLSSDEEEKFLQHMEQCEDCRKEEKDLKNGMMDLAHTTPKIETPFSLKSEILSPIFESAEKTSHKEIGLNIGDKLKENPNQNRNGFWGRLSSQFTPVSAVCILILLFISTTLGWQNHYLNNPTAGKNEIIYQKLNHTPSAETASGMVAIWPEKEGLEIYIMVENLPPTKGNDAYQVWLLKNGNRENAGIFYVDNQGKALHIYHSNQIKRYDAVGITLEPDAEGNQPHGVKVLGSEF